MHVERRAPINSNFVRPAISLSGARNPMPKYGLRQRRTGFDVIEQQRLAGESTGEQFASCRRKNVDIAELR